MNGLQTAIVPGTTSPAIAIGTVLLSGYRRLGRPQPAGHVGLVLVDAIERGVAITETDLLREAKVELTLRHGARIDRLALMGATDSILAVGFDGRVLQARRAGDPVDILLPWAGYQGNGKFLTDFWRALRAMLSADPDNLWLRQSAFEMVVENLRDLAGRRVFGDNRDQALFNHVLAANIDLCYAALDANGSSSRSGRL